jgi:hypothetical protein
MDSSAYMHSIPPNWICRNKVHLFHKCIRQLQNTTQGRKKQPKREYCNYKKFLKESVFTYGKRCTFIALLQLNFLYDHSYRRFFMSITYGYIRVSSAEQNEDRQRIAMKEFGITDKNMILDKQSGKDFLRPGYHAPVKTAPSW